MSDEVQAEPRATPPQYQAKVFKIWALQYNGTNQQEMLDFGKTFLYLTPEGALMVTGSPFPFLVGEWLIQWSNTEKRGQYDRASEANFNLTWLVI